MSFMKSGCSWISFQVHTRLSILETDHDRIWQIYSDLSSDLFRSEFILRNRNMIVFNHDTSWQPSLADRQEMTITSTSAIQNHVQNFEGMEIRQRKVAACRYGKIWWILMDFGHFGSPWVSCTDPAHLRPTCCRHRQRKRVGQGSRRWQRGSLPPWR